MNSSFFRFGAQDVFSVPDKVLRSEHAPRFRIHLLNKLNGHIPYVRRKRACLSRIPHDVWMNVILPYLDAFSRGALLCVDKLANQHLSPVVSKNYLHCNARTARVRTYWTTPVKLCDQLMDHYRFMHVMDSWTNGWHPTALFRELKQLEKRPIVWSHYHEETQWQVKSRQRQTSQATSSQPQPLHNIVK